jgi:hypothetical protein
VLLAAGCKKNSTAVVNFNCYVAGPVLNSDKAALISGNAQTLYDATNEVFQIIMLGPYNQSVVITWYNISSLSAVSSFSTGVYTLPAHILPPTYIAGVYTAPYGGYSYSTGGGGITSGTVTLTKNTGAGGVLSGTFSFTASNTSGLADTAYVTQGTFTDLPIAAN